MNTAPILHKQNDSAPGGVVTNRRIITKKTRRARRSQAAAVLQQLEPDIHRARINDAKSAHCTIWLDRESRIEWWPGTARWRGPDGVMHEGSANDLIRFVRAAVRLLIEPAVASHLQAIRQEVAA